MDDEGDTKGSFRLDSGGWRWAVGALLIDRFPATESGC